MVQELVESRVAGTLWKQLWLCKGALYGCAQGNWMVRHTGAGKGATYVKSQCQCPTVTMQQESRDVLQRFALKRVCTKVLVKLQL